MSCKGCEEKRWKFADAIEKEEMRRALVEKIEGVWNHLTLLKNKECMICSTQAAHVSPISPIRRYDFKNVFSTCSNCFPHYLQSKEFIKKLEEWKYATELAHSIRPFTAHLEELSFNELLEEETRIRMGISFINDIIKGGNHVE